MQCNSSSYCCSWSFAWGRPSFWQPQKGHENCNFETLHNEKKCFECQRIKFQWINGSPFSHMLTVRAEGADSPPHTVSLTVKCLLSLWLLYWKGVVVASFLIPGCCSRSWPTCSASSSYPALGGNPSSPYVRLKSFLKLFSVQQFSCNRLCLVLPSSSAASCKDKLP